jgi:nitrogen regulatory protein PII
MKKLEVIFAHEHLVEINNLLHKHGVGGMNFHLIRGRGRTKTETASKIVDDILEVMSSGANRSGKIFVYDVIEAYDFKNKETGFTAL